MLEKVNGSREKVVKFSSDLESNILELSRQLESKSYCPKGFKNFTLFDPKEREISAPYFRDRVVHRSLHRVLEPIFEKRFIYDTYACRPNKGTHAGVDRLQGFMRKQDTDYYLKCDIRAYFDSVDHSILVQEVGRKVSDERVLWLVKKFLENYSSNIGENKGMPIGTLYSQLFANIYLDRFDHFVKQSLEASYYIRYMDDFILLSDSKNRLHGLKDAMQGYLESELELDLPDSKTTLEPIEKGATFLGYRVFPHYLLLRKRNKLKFKRRLSRQKGELKNGELSFQELRQSIASWRGHAEHADTENLRREYRGELRG
ncbi:MAG: reverse transcriptase domain-containing protein [Candidatus Nanohalobium sp.]